MPANRACASSFICREFVGAQSWTGTFYAPGCVDGWRTIHASCNSYDPTVLDHQTTYPNGDRPMWTDVMSEHNKEGWPIHLMHLGGDQLYMDHLAFQVDKPTYGLLGFILRKPMHVFGLAMMINSVHVVNVCASIHEVHGLSSNSVANWLWRNHPCNPVTRVILVLACQVASFHPTDYDCYDMRHTGNDRADFWKALKADDTSRQQLEDSFLRHYTRVFGGDMSTALASIPSVMMW